MNQDFLTQWGEAAYTSVGFFWSALWAFALGYVVSSMIQVFVTQERMQRSLGDTNARSVGLATFFGFISSSCSFAALATTRSLFQKGAGFVPAMAFLLASTNLVIELGIIISVFLSWHFVVGEYLGGALLILFSWLFIRLTRPKKLIKQAKERVGDDDYSGDVPDWKKLIRSWAGWKGVGMRYQMEWNMVWKDVTVGFTIAGIVAAFVPRSFFETLFLGVGSGDSFTFFQILEHTLVGPLAAFFTFIGSMGNIPLAALLYQNGVSFAGVMAFIFSDLVVFPVLRINATYYGWRMSLFIMLTLFVALIGTTLILHYGFDLLGALPETGSASSQQQNFFTIDYTFFLNFAFLAVSGFLIWLGFFKKADGDVPMGGHHMASKGAVDTILKYAAFASYAWLAGGLAVRFFG
ncbi:MAG: permease [Tunicatimonas sp.]